MKKEDIWFIEWEQRVFGAGYGTGEGPILKAVKGFFDALDGDQYDHEYLEKKLGDTVTWLLINAFCKADIIEWGTSARHGWLTSSGEYLRDYINRKSVGELYEIVMSDHDGICLCDGEIEGHHTCGKNPFVNEKYADELKYKVNP